MNRRIAVTIILVWSTTSTLAGSMIDPTRPAGARTVAPTPDAFHLEAIVISDTAQWAIVNGVIVHRGDHIANAVIDEITARTVRYTRNGHSETASLSHASLQVRRNESSHEDSP